MTCDTVLCYHRKIKQLILVGYCRYQRFARHLNIGDSPIQVGNFCYDFTIFFSRLFQEA